MINNFLPEIYSTRKLNSGRDLTKILTTPEAPAVIAIGAVTALSPDEHMTGILTARDIEYAAAKVGVAYNNQ